MDPRPEPSRRTVDHATCLACGCLCDDIRVEVDVGSNRVVEAAHACPLGSPWFLAPHPGEGCPPASIDGQPADLEAALDRASAILRAARGPVVWGLLGASVEAQAVAVAIADRLGAAIDPGGRGAAKLRAFQRVGQVGGTFGEVKSRADLVVSWGFDPITTHPRLNERYALDPRSRFLPRGRLDRTWVVVDDRDTPSARAADRRFAIPTGRRGDALWGLRALVQGLDLDPAAVEHSVGIPFADLRDLAGVLTACRYGALFFDPGGLDDWEAEALLSLVRDLNRGRRFVALGVGSGGNGAGAEAVLAWESGSPSAVDFALGHPRHLPGEATLAARLAAGTADAALIVADDPASSLDPDLLDRLGSIPTVAIGPGVTRADRLASVAFAVGRLGIEAGGTVGRPDGVMLPSRPALDPGWPDALAILDGILRRL